MDDAQFRRFLDALAGEGAALADAAVAGDLTTAVLGCPGWTVDDVVFHTAGVYAHKRAVLALGHPPDQEQVPPGPPDGANAVPWFREQLAALVAELSAHDSGDRTWTWLPSDQSVGFWARRMAQETVVHRLDVEGAAGSPGPVADWLAVDGVDEMLSSFLAADPWHDVPAGPDAGTVEVAAGDRVWRVRLAAGQTRLSPDEPGHADARVAADPGIALSWVWGRVVDDAVSLSGDATAVVELTRRLRAVS